MKWRRIQVKTVNSQSAITLSKAWMLSKSWKRASIIWRFLDHFFAVGSFTASISTVYIASGVSEENPLIIVLSSIAAFLSLSGFACNPRKYMTGYRKAFQELNHALVEHTDERPANKSQVLNWQNFKTSFRRKGATQLSRLALRFWNGSYPLVKVGCYSASRASR